MDNVFGTLISGVSCILAINYRQHYFVLGGGGGTYLKAGANSNVNSTCAPFNNNKRPSLSPLLSSDV